MASAGQTEDRNGSNPSASSSGLPQVSQGEQRGAPQLGSTLCLSDQWERCLESGGDNPEVLNEQDLAFLVNHIRKGTKGTYKSRWCRFAKFCESRGIDPQWAPVSLIVKFIRHLFESKFSCSVVNTAVSAISKYHVVDKDTSIPIGQHSLGFMAKNVFWQQRLPFPTYRATYDFSVILRHIQNLGQNESLSLKMLSGKKVFLVVFSTLAR